MTQQLQLGLLQRAPTATPEDVAALVAILAAEPDWIKARHLTPLTGWDDRALRNLANASNGHIISGTRGYRLTRLATIEEINRCTATLRSQADAMTLRALQIDRVYHGKLRPE